MGLFGKIATLASVGLPAKAVKNAIAGRAASATSKTMAGAGGTPPPPPPPGAGGAGGGTASRAKTMTTGGTGGFQSPPPPPPPKAGQTVYAAGADFNKKTKPEPVRNAWREGGKK